MTPRALGHRSVGIALLLGTLVSTTLIEPSTASEWQVVIGTDSPRVTRIAYDRGYQGGLREGERDARDRRGPDVERHRAYRNARDGYSRAYGDRTLYQDAFRSGFLDGYRDGFDRLGVRAVRGVRGAVDRRARGGFSEAASARGYADGFEQGLDDGRDRDHYDPVRHRDYRSADNGYTGDYGSREAYRNQYRIGFRQGYEDGYRTGLRRR